MRRRYLRDEVFALRSDLKLVVEDQLASFDHLHELSVVLRVEGWEAHEQLVGEDAETPPVGRLGVAFLRDDFGGQVEDGAAHGVGLVFFPHELREAEVCELRVAFVVQQDVLELEVSGVTSAYL